MTVRSGCTRFFNEHLGPLRRFLDTNVGRPWDRVYSEICQHVDRGNVVQKHILTHLFDYIVTDTVLIGGQPCRGGGRRYGESLRNSNDRYQWFVCPKSGLLRKSRYVPYRANRAAQPRRVVLNNRTVCIKRDGQWELLEVALVSQPDRRVSPAYGLILDRHIDCRPKLAGCAVDSHAGNIYKVRRRPLSRKELLALPIPIDWLS